MLISISIGNKPIERIISPELRSRAQAGRAAHHIVAAYTVVIDDHASPRVEVAEAVVLDEYNLLGLCRGGVVVWSGCDGPEVVYETITRLVSPKVGQRKAA